MKTAVYVPCVNQTAWKLARDTGSVLVTRHDGFCGSDLLSKFIIEKNHFHPFLLLNHFSTSFNSRSTPSIVVSNYKLGLANVQAV
jgi:hypothetical protein